MTSICKIDIIEKEVQNYFSHIITQPSWPFNLQPLFWKGVEKWFEKPGLRNLVWEIWFKKSGSRKMVLQTWIFFMRKVVDKKKNPHFFRLEKSGSANSYFFFWFEKSGWPEKKVVLYHKSTFFLVREKWLTRKKNVSLKNHFSRTTFLHFSRKVVAE